MVLGLSYAGTANIMLNGLGIVLSPEDNPGYLPGLNAGAFNLGAGLSYAILYGVQQGFSDAHGATMGYTGAMIGRIILPGACIPEFAAHSETSSECRRGALT